MDTPFFIEKLIQEHIVELKADFKGSEDDFKKMVDEKLTKYLDDITGKVVKQIYSYCTSKKSDLKKREVEIGKRIKTKYQLGLQLFEGFIELNTQISSMFYNKYYKVFDTPDDQIKLDTLIANHVRACQVANEIKVLVANGFADGAHARWRTLHEICVTFLYLYDAGYETIAMYNDYEVIEQWKKAKEYNQTAQKFGWKVMEDVELSQLEAEKTQLIEQYGKDYVEGQGYGWAMKDLPKGKRNFKEMENLVDKAYLRSIYAWANESVHAGVSGIRQKLSLRQDEQYHFLTGPNDCGFLDPVQYTTYSLTAMSEVLLGMEDSMIHHIYEEVLYFFQNEVVNEFDRLESEE